MVLKLYAAADSAKTKRVLICATYNGIAVDAPPAGPGAEGKMPVLETDEGCVFSTNAIARYVARMRRDTGLYGQTFIESGAIDGWVEFCTHELEVPLCVWVYPKLGKFAEVPAATEQAKVDVSKALAILNNHLESQTYIVGHQVTLADITLLTTLHDAMVHVFDAAFRAQFPNLMRWFSTCVTQPEVAKVLGQVACLGEKPIIMAKGQGKPAAAASPKKGKDASPKKDGKKEVKAAPAAAPAAGGGADSPELAAVKKAIADKKAELKASGVAAVNKDPAVIALVEKMKAIQAGGAAAPAPAASPKKGGKASPKKGPAAAPAPAGGDSSELEAVKKAIVDKKAELKAAGCAAVNKDPAVTALVEKMKALQAGGPAKPAAAAGAPVDAGKLEKVVKKEGGKKGAEIAGAADMGGMSFMNVSVDSPEGDLALMKMCVDAMNVVPDPTQEESKGGAGHVGKMLFSYGKDQVGMVANIPDEVKDKVNAKTWMEKVVGPLKGKVVESSAQYATGVVLGNGAKGLYPIKLKDEALQNSIRYLQEIGVFPTGGDSDSEEMVFGDDDFPCG